VNRRNVLGVDRLLLVANARAGTLERQALAAALDVLRPRTEVEVVETRSPEELEQVLLRIEGRSLVVAGGDGTLHAVVNALHRRGLLEKVRLGLVPLGTGNDFARGVGIPVDAVEAAGLVVSGVSTKVDLIVDDTGLVAVNNAHLGVGAQASHAAQKWKPRLGRLGYAVGALVAGMRPRFLRLRVAVDGRQLVRHRRVAQVAIGNGSRVGGGTELIPGAHPSSGDLHVIVSRARGRWRRLAYLARLRFGTHDQMKEVERATGREVAVVGDPFYVVTDGELSGPHTRRTWRVLPGALEMYLPAYPPAG
jgi:diacylglycerol kinase (ATP)